MAPSLPKTFPDLLSQRVSAHGERRFLPRRDAHSDESIPFSRLLADIDALAMALVDLGLAPGDRIGLLAENRYEWLLVDLALASIGAPDVPRGADTTPTEMRFILRHSGARMCFADDERTARDVLEMRDELPDLEEVVVMNDAAAQVGTTALGDLLRRGRSLLPGRADELAARRAAVAPDDLLTIVYTSGTTADPKGVMLTHGNVLANVHTTREVLGISAEDTFLSVLPAWHMYERIMDYLALTTGGELLYTDRRRIKKDLAAERPTVFAAVPRIWEMLHDGVQNQAIKQTGTRGALLRAALRTSQAVGAGRAGLWQRMQHAVLRPLVLRKILAAFGGRLRLCVSGGGALPRHVDETLLGIGLPLLNGYGLTETSPVAAVRRLEDNSPGHIGPPLPDTEIEARSPGGERLAVGETGVLWIRGPQVMRGYYRNPERTAEVLDEDGWFCSGDLGHLDARGHVWITGRAKDTIVLAGGENVEPEPIETLIKTSPYIEQAVCLGQDRKALVALLVPMHEAIEERVPRSEWEADGALLRGDPLRKLLRAELDRLLTRDNGCRPCERIADFRVLAEPMTPESGLLTPTLKVKRHVVREHYASAIAEMVGE